MAEPRPLPELVVTHSDRIQKDCDPGILDPGYDPIMKGSVDNMDSYTQGIELSNACRRFYVSRVQVAEGVKAKLGLNLGSSGSRTLDQSMCKLRTEMASLIDQDLSLMKQLLTLNERIEELKWQRKFSGYSATSAATSVSSANMLDSDACILSDTGAEPSAQSDWDSEGVPPAREQLTVPRDCESEKDLLYSKYLSPSNLSLFRECVYSSTGESLHDMPLSSSHISMATRAKLSHDTQLRSTSDLGSSDELVNSATDIRKDILWNRLSQADSSISMDCASNSNSLRREDDNDNNNYTKPRISEKSYRAVHNTVVQTIPTIAVRVHIEEDEEDEEDEEEEDSNKHSHDSGIQELDHNLEMTI